MKTFILLATVCLFGVASAAPTALKPTGLQKDLADFMALVPTDKVEELAKKYENDPEILESRRYFHSQEFATIWDQLSGSPELRDLVYYLNDAGLQVIEYLDNLALLLGLPKFPSPSNIAKRSTVQTGGMKGYYDELLELLPKEDIKALYHEKMQSSKEFAELYHKIASADFQKILKFVKDSPELTESFNKLREHGIDVDRMGDFMARLFGWKQ